MPDNDRSLNDAMHLVDSAEEIYEAIRGALAGQGWFDCWDSVNEAAALATRMILAAGPPIMEPEWRAFCREEFDGDDA